MYQITSQLPQQCLYNHSFQSVFTIYVSIKSTENKKRSPDKFKAILD
jgi:hypothetical protein